MTDMARQRVPAMIEGWLSVEEWLAFIASYDSCDVSNRQFAYRIRERVFGELYWRERKQQSEWVDIGGEGGEA